MHVSFYQAKCDEIETLLIIPSFWIRHCVQCQSAGFFKQGNRFLGRLWSSLQDVFKQYRWQPEYGFICCYGGCIGCYNFHPRSGIFGNLLSSGQLNFYYVSTTEEWGTGCQVNPGGH